MNFNRYFVHLTVLCFLGTAVTFAYPFEGITEAGASHGEVREQGRPSVGVAGTWQGTEACDAEIRVLERAYRGFFADHRAVAQAAMDPQPTTALEEEIQLLREAYVRFLIARSAIEARAAAACLWTH